MKHNKKAFTLLELLVVVLIIGIVSAVALPQYQKAVEKARLVQNIVTVRALYDALEVYRLANGSYPPTPNGKPGGTYNVSYFNDLLSISIQTDKKVGYYPSSYISQDNIQMNWGVGGGKGKGKLICFAHPTDTSYEKRKTFCLSVCSDKQWRSWEHGEYCII